jgi:hypothetical protein
LVKGLETINCIAVPLEGVEPPNVIKFALIGIVAVTDREVPFVFVAVNVYEPERFTSVGVPDKRYILGPE